MTDEQARIQARLMEAGVVIHLARKLDGWDGATARFASIYDGSALDGRGRRACWSSARAQANDRLEQELTPLQRRGQAAADRRPSAPSAIAMRPAPSTAPSIPATGWHANSARRSIAIGSVISARRLPWLRAGGGHERSPEQGTGEAAAARSQPAQHGPAPASLRAHPQSLSPGRADERRPDRGDPPRLAPAAGRCRVRGAACGEPRDPEAGRRQGG